MVILGAPLKFTGFELSPVSDTSCVLNLDLGKATQRLLHYLK